MLSNPSIARIHALCSRARPTTFDLFVMPLVAILDGLGVESVLQNVLQLAPVAAVKNLLDHPSSQVRTPEAVSRLPERPLETN
jgi:hypothetical protein